MQNSLPAIPYGKIPKVLLVGNGINRAFGGEAWYDLIGGMNKKQDTRVTKVLNEVPYPIRAVITTNDNVDENIRKVCEKMIQLEPSKEQLDLLREYLDLPIDAILTTNYSYEIEKAIEPNFFCKINVRNKWRKNTVDTSQTKDEFGLFKYFEFECSGSEKRVWHIHGEAARPNSVVVGHYYYCNLLNRIIKQAADVIRGYRSSCKKGIDYQPKSWIDYFLIGEVFIIGFGMDFSEMDIWWLINLKKREFANCGKIHWYEAGSNGREATKLLAECYNVEVANVKSNEYYISFYKNVLKEIAEADS